MSDASVRLAGRLPDGNRNGLASIVDDLVDDPSAIHVAIVLLDCSHLKTSVDDGSVLPTARIRAIEPISEGPDANEMRRLLRRAVEKRTGQTALPLDLERALDDLGIHADVPGCGAACSEAHTYEPGCQQYREPDFRERAAGVEREDPLAAPPDTTDAPVDPQQPSPDTTDAPADPLAPSPDAMLDAAAPDDVLAEDDPRRITLPRNGLFLAPPPQDEDDDQP